MRKDERSPLACDYPKPHPVGHIDGAVRYEWLRSECSELHNARQAREDNLIASITSISSASLLAIPSLLFALEKDFPSIRDGYLLYIPLGGLLLTLMLCMLEQYLSAIGFRRQIAIVQNYYLMLSEQQDDLGFVKWIRGARNLACILFAMSILLSMLAIANFERANDDRAQSSNPTTVTTTK